MATLNDLSDADLRELASEYGVNVEGLDREDVIEILHEEGLGASDALVSGDAPSLPSLSNGSEILRRGPVDVPDLPDLEPVLARGVEPQPAGPPSTTANYPERAPEPERY